MFTRIETERLVLRRFTDGDAEPLLAYRSDPEVARYQVWQPWDDPQVARDWVATVKDGEPGTPGQWFQFAIDAEGVMVGDVGLRTDTDPRVMEIGFTLSRGAQGKG